MITDPVLDEILLSVYTYSKKVPAQHRTLDPAAAGQKFSWDSHDWECFFVKTGSVLNTNTKENIS